VGVPKAVPGTCIVGMQWGDEAKAHVVDMLTRKADIVVRTQGGANAGHTVVLGNETFKFRLIPSGLLHRGKACVVGNGVVIDAEELLGEAKHLEQRGVEVAGHLYISERAHLVMPYHKLAEKLTEAALKDARIGTTGRGIGPCYADKMSRSGLRVCDLYSPQRFKEILRRNVEQKNRLFGELFGSEPLSWEPVFERFMELAGQLKPFVTDTAVFLNQAAAEGKNILFEGAQGSLLDIDHGTYPYVTSSNASVGGVSTGAGVGPKLLTRVVGVLKAYTTRVGEGPFPTELDDQTGRTMRERGNEFGTVTGRPRRCGWLDGVAARYAAMLNGVDNIAITKLDILDVFDIIKVCVAYRHNGRLVERFPSDVELLQRAEPVYDELPGWRSDTSKVRRFEDLPEAAQGYIRYIEKLVGVRACLVTVGPERNEGIEMT